MTNFEEFRKTTYYTEKQVVIPLLNLRLNKTDFFKKNKLDLDLLNSKLRSLYDENLKKFIK